MRGLLVCPISADFPGNRGILNKMAYQRAAFAELAGTMDVVCNGVHAPLFDGDRFAEYWVTGHGFNSFNHYVLFYQRIWKHCRPAEYDFLYIRYPLATPSFLRLLQRTKKANPEIKIVLEVPTFPYRQELRSPKQRFLLALDELGHRRLKAYVDAIVTFFGQKEIFGIPCIQIQNGIDVDSIPFVTKSAFGPVFSMIVVANLARWHGVDRMLHGLAEYRESVGANPVKLNIVGDGPAEGDLRALTRDLGLEATVHFHGMCGGIELDELFAEADLALGSLAMHRLGLTRSSSLKTREYCARGLPFLLASDDPDFPEGIPFARQVPGDETPIDVGAAVDFVGRLRARNREYMRDMRRYAEDRLTWKAKLDSVVGYVRRGEFPEMKEVR